ncbi:MAG TPA: DUF2946 family protein [Methylocystis sp.]|nr:DUF2946 family protein [Methylocystis sp.]
MSHCGSKIVLLRALVAVVLVCVLALGQIGAAVARDAGPTERVSLHAVAKSAHCAAMAHLASDAGAAGGHHKHRGSPGCPLCCLLANAAVLPERSGTPVRVERDPATRDSFVIGLISHEPESLVSPTVNGARAPPCLALV